MDPFAAPEAAAAPTVPRPEISAFTQTCSVLSGLEANGADAFDTATSGDPYDSVHDPSAPYVYVVLGYFLAASHAIIAQEKEFSWSLITLVTSGAIVGFGFKGRGMTIVITQVFCCWTAAILGSGIGLKDLTTPRKNIRTVIFLTISFAGAVVAASTVCYGTLIYHEMLWTSVTVFLLLVFVLALSGETGRAFMLICLVMFACVVSYFAGIDKLLPPGLLRVAFPCMTGGDLAYVHGKGMTLPPVRVSSLQNIRCTMRLVKWTGQCLTHWHITEVTDNTILAMVKAFWAVTVLIMAVIFIVAIIRMFKYLLINSDEHVPAIVIYGTHGPYCLYQYLTNEELYKKCDNVVRTLVLVVLFNLLGAYACAMINPILGMFYLLVSCILSATLGCDLTDVFVKKVDKPEDKTQSRKGSEASKGPKHPGTPSPKSQPPLSRVGSRSDKDIEDEIDRRVKETLARQQGTMPSIQEDTKSIPGTEVTDIPASISEAGGASTATTKAKNKPKNPKRKKGQEESTKILGAYMGGVNVLVAKHVFDESVTHICGVKVDTHYKHASEDLTLVKLTEAPTSIPAVKAGPKPALNAEVCEYDGTVIGTIESITGNVITVRGSHIAGNSSASYFTPHKGLIGIHKGDSTVEGCFEMTFPVVVKQLV
jgi:hypothetical protein